MCGRLSGLSPRDARRKTEEILDTVRILYAADRPVRRLSKGMVQRAGLAAALVADPELLILDEPMSGLDPVGRKEVRDLILKERARGRTIFFSTHILGDVEMLCNHVTIMRRGEVVVSGEISELLRRDVQRVEVAVRDAPPELDAWCTGKGYSTNRTGKHLSVDVVGTQAQDELVRHVISSGMSLAAITPRIETLEDLFVREAIFETL